MVSVVGTVQRKKRRVTFSDLIHYFTFWIGTFCSPQCARDQAGRQAMDHERMCDKHINLYLHSCFFLAFLALTWRPALHPVARSSSYGMVTPPLYKNSSMTPPFLPTGKWSISSALFQPCNSRQCQFPIEAKSGSSQVIGFASHSTHPFDWMAEFHIHAQPPSPFLILTGFSSPGISFANLGKRVCGTPCNSTQ